MTGTTDVVCALVRYLDDGTAVTDWWTPDPDIAGVVVGILGEPVAQTVTTADQIDADEAAATPAPILWRPGAVGT